MQIEDDGNNEEVVEDLELFRQELMSNLEKWQQHNHSKSKNEIDDDIINSIDTKQLWSKYESLTSQSAQELTEQLRIVLEPTLATKLKGDYRTGKRLNMKKIIPYIASQFKKDKIWLRRTKPSKREYQVLLAIDDSESMSDSSSISLAFEALALISKSLTLLEVGELGIVSFSDQVKLLHPFHESFSDEAGVNILPQFTFSKTSTDFNELLQSSRKYFGSSAKATDLPVSQLQFIISDGICTDVESLKKDIIAMNDAGILVCFIIVDNPKSKHSILDYKTVSYPNGKLKMTPYLDSFPFPYYVVLRDVNALPGIIADALRQWFEFLS